MTIEKYKISESGTFYKKETPAELVKILDHCLKNRIRITVDYGNIQTKKSWGECHYINGYVGRSTGSIKIPLLVHNSRSHGGGGLLDDCILSVKTSKGKISLYQL